MDRIIIDLTHYCDLSCADCNRSCGHDQAPAKETISPLQVHHFVEESILAGRRWKRIWLEGGEPMLHPQLDEIVDILMRYRRDHNRGCEILLCTNGFGEKMDELRHLSANIMIRNSTKHPASRTGHFTFNVAPVDLVQFSGADFSRGCYIHRLFGIGLNRNGYYPHPVCGGIDRVFGFDIGFKNLPRSAAEMAEQMQQLCRFCGHFREFYKAEGRKKIPFRRTGENLGEGSRTESWIKAYRAFREKPPVLTPY